MAAVRKPRPASPAECNRYLQELYAKRSETNGQPPMGWLRSWRKRIQQRHGPDWAAVLLSVNTSLQLTQQIGGVTNNLSFRGAHIAKVVAVMNPNSGEQNIQTGSGKLVRGDDSSMHAGRDMKAVSGGKGNEALFENITFYEQHVAQTQIPEHLKSALIAARKELDTLALSDVVKAEVVRNFDRLTEELSKPKPEKSTLQYFWDALPSAAKILSSVATVGTLLVKGYQLVTG